MNKNFIKMISLMVLFGFIVTPIFALTKANQLKNSRGVFEAFAIADPVTGDCLRVGTEHVVRKPDAYELNATDYSATLVRGACIVHSITVTGTDAGDYAYIYDGTGIKRGGRSGYDLVAEIYVGTAADSKTIVFPFGLKFSNDVGIKTKDGDVDVAVAYSN